MVNNIHNVLNKTNAKISIRFNASNDNIFHLYDDVLYLQEEFKEYENKKIDFYVAPLFQLINDDSEIVDGYDEELERLKEIVRVFWVFFCFLLFEGWGNCLVFYVLITY